jgi:hypothetical protein
MGVMQQVSGQIYVRPLLFRLDYPRVLLRMSGGHDERHCDHVGQEVTEMNGHLRECSKRPQVELLPYRLVWIIGAGPIPGR